MAQLLRGFLTGRFGGLRSEDANLEMARHMLLNSLIAAGSVWDGACGWTCPRPLA